ncbi:pyridoxamine 5'-phosphate oxidase family protein [candidate division WOR-3 bacterium]|nr:pyridoxamine 5'-phosphate oxidase family protein [candidate division WOR-3 bacterium]
MEKEDAIEKGLSLVNRSTIAMLGTNGEGGYPNIRAMIKMENEGLKTIWFSTNTSSRKIPQLKKNPKACVYFVDFDKWIGLMLVGTTEIRKDQQSREHLWREGYEKYYPKGVNDPDYSVLRFTTQWGRYYHSLNHVTFEL